MNIRIGLVTSVVLLVVGAGGVRAQDIAQIERNIQRAEQMLKSQPELTQYCAQLKTGDFFFHRGRLAAGKHPIVSLAAWEAAARRQAPDRADDLVQRAKRLRGEQQNACSLDDWKAELARLRRPKETGSAPASIAWNESPDGNRPIGGKGTLAGDMSAWRFTGPITTSWNDKISVTVTCTGKLDPGVSPKPGAKGSMECKAQWRDGGQTHEWRCNGNGESWGDWSITSGHWFAIGPTGCIGSVVTNGKTADRKFGLVVLRSKLGMPP
ncbi:MAG TPA: hypothetical protein VJ890_21825 [Vineibacter sp.]|nr:hypothetical protein [Vineibacter sp.]